MELKTQLRRGHDERCPYCHDILADTRLAEVTCPGCQTVHHVVCVRELGRCTVMGCSQSIVLPEPDRTWEDSPELRRVRQRLRERVRLFVGNHAKHRKERLIQALERARELEAEGRYRAAADAYEDVAYLERTPEIRGDPTLEGLEGRMDAMHARAKSREMHDLHIKQFGRRTLLALFLLVGVPAFFLWVLVVTGAYGG